MDLVVMAAGMGSRFGGLKQIEPINNNGEFILDYSIYDAIRAGFDRVIFVIRKENLDIFKQTIGKRMRNRINVEYVFQEMTNLPIQISSQRKKPLGTGHALFCAKKVLSDKFAVINADDFYGEDAFKVLFDFLKHNDDKTNFATVNYPIWQTLSDVGACKRGICKVNNDEIMEIVEAEVEKINGKIHAVSLLKKETFYVDCDIPVAVNMFGFNRSLFDFLVPSFERFLLENRENLLDCEFMLPEVLAEMMMAKKAKLISLKTKAEWHGVTYRNDKESLMEYIKNQTLKGFYPSRLWD